MSATTNTPSRADFRIAIICPLPLEAKVAKPLLKPVYDQIAHPELAQKADDPNSYTLGKVGPYYAVLVHMPTAGKAAASSAATNVRSSYPDIELAFLIGVCGGVPRVERSHITTGRTDVYLGDVIVSTGVVQYDLGKRLPSGFVRKDTLESNLGRPNQQIRSFISKIMAGDDHLARRQGEYLAIIQDAVDAMRPGIQDDVLFRQDYNHRKRGCQCEKSAPTDETLLARQRKSDILPYIHFGRLASGDTVMMTAKARDAIANKEQVIGFEMEGAGVWEALPCILVKGVSDYADSHKGKDWQLFAAASAAACMRALLDERPISISQRSTGAGSVNSIPLRTTVQKRPSDKAAQESNEAYLELLTFTRANFRRNKVLAPHEKTCKWMLMRPEYQSWVHADTEGVPRRFFWIKGKPGAGKSTLMKFLLHSATSDKANDVVLSFFFYAQGTELERSIVGMYRSLLYQLLCSPAVSPEKKQVFFDIAADIQTESGLVHWTRDDLESLLLSIIPALVGRRIIILIDALDEGEEKDIRQMIAFLQQQLISCGNSDGVQLRICLASRHYPSLVIDSAIQLVLEDQLEHESDIREYVEARFNGGRSQKAQEIRAEICEKASGVFLWVHLVVRSLNEAFETGNLHTVRERLDGTPDDLDALFISILTRDQQRLSDMLFCLELVLFSPRPLSSEEAYFAMMFHKCGLVQRDIQLHTDSMLANYIVNVSKGIVEVSRSKAHAVHFIHESVRDFLLQRDGFTRLQSEHSTDYRGLSHERMARVCFDYICKVSSDESFEDALKTLAGLPRARQRDYMKEHVPFFGYARSNVLFHSNEAQAAGVSQVDFLRQLRDALLAFKHIYNTVECPKVSRYKDSVSLLYILADQSLSHLVSLQVSLTGYDWSPGGRYKWPMGTAIRSGSLATTRALLGCTTAAESINDTGLLRTPTIAAMKDHLVESQGRGGQSATKRYKPFLVDTAIAVGDATFLMLLVQTGEVNLVDVIHGTCAKGQANLLRILLDCWRSNPRTAGKEYPKFFPPPSGLDKGHMDVINVLLDYGLLDIDFRFPNHWNCGVLHRVIGYGDGYGDAATVKRLINAGCDATFRDSRGQDPLCYAAEVGQVEAVRILTKVDGVGIDAKDGNGRTPLSFAAGAPRSAGCATVSALLETGLVDINSEDKLGRTPVFWAIVSNNAATVSHLLGVPQINIDFKMASGYTPLLFAAARSSAKIIKLLLATGRVDVNARDSHGRTPLSWAVGPCFPYKGVEWQMQYRRTRLNKVMALLTCPKIRPTTPDAFGYSPLDWAQIYHRLMRAVYGEGRLEDEGDIMMGEHEAIVTLLAQHGVVEGVPDASLDPRDYQSCYSCDLKRLFHLADFWYRLVSREQLVKLGRVRRTTGSRDLGDPRDGPNGRR
ncbi:hypothetical protein BJY00DRAFT_208554 [Aspergillus carlsbadensis]|nr:hypothetical protein BJY00DRAFT_208554 [Aspergillus carlsbadensis]